MLDQISAVVNCSLAAQPASILTISGEIYE
jgi:hypothetical protein